MALKCRPPLSSLQDSVCLDRGIGHSVGAHIPREAQRSSSEPGISAIPAQYLFSARTYFNCATRFVALYGTGTSVVVTRFNLLEFVIHDSLHRFQRVSGASP